MAKSFFRKSVIVVIMVAFVSVCANAQSINIDSIVANAQRVVNDINSLDAQACGEYLLKNPQAVIQNKAIIRLDGAVIDRYVYWEDGAPTAFNDTLRDNIQVVYSQEVVSADSVSVNSRTESKLSGNAPQDRIYTKSEVMKQYRDSLNGDVVDPYAGVTLLQSADKYGPSIEVHAGWAIANGINGPIAGVGVSYDRAYWGAYLNGEIGKSKYSENAVNAGSEYRTYRAEGALMLRPVQFDGYDQNRLFVFGGAGFEHYKTDSRPIEMEDGQVSNLSSEGNYLYATAGVAYEYRIFATGNTLGARLQWRNTRATVQNSGDEIFGSWVLSVYFKFGVNRNRVHTK